MTIATPELQSKSADLASPPQPSFGSIAEGSTWRPADAAVPGPSAAARVQAGDLTETDRHFGLAIHLTPLAAPMFPLAVFAPIVLWLVRKDRSSFVNDHGREMVNVLITGMVVYAVCFLAGFVTFGLGWLAILAWQIVIVIGMVRGALACSRGEYFRYPMVFRFLT